MFTVAKNNSVPHLVLSSYRGPVLALGAVCMPCENLQLVLCCALALLLSLKTQSPEAGCLFSKKLQNCRFLLAQFTFICNKCREISSEDPGGRRSVSCLLM